MKWSLADPPYRAPGSVANHPVLEPLAQTLRCDETSYTVTEHATRLGLTERVQVSPKNRENWLLVISGEPRDHAVAALERRHTTGA